MTTNPSDRDPLEDERELEPHLEDALRRVEHGERIDLFSWRTPQMRAFHMSWFAFFLAFFGWFGIAPLMPIVRDDLQLTSGQLGNTVIASVALTAFARPVVGWLCDRFGPRLTYTGLLCLGGLPVMCIGLSQNYETLLLLRLAIGVVGAGFVVTQYHSSVMFGADVVGTANATTAGWGNLGGGVTQIMMPLVLTAIVMVGVEEYLAWRLAMIVPGAALLLMGLAYFFVTQDTPFGNFSQLRAQGRMLSSAQTDVGFRKIARDYRVWGLFLAYAACFGVELTINNIAALYFYDRFELSLRLAGIVAGLFGLMNLFARPLGGMIGDRAGIRFGISGRVTLLSVLLLMEAGALVVFANMSVLYLAIPAMIVFSLFVQMSEGATYSVVPFINRAALGSVTGIVGAGGNAGAVAFGFLFRSESLSTPDALTWIAAFVAVTSLLMFALRSSFESRQA